MNAERSLAQAPASSATRVVGLWRGREIDVLATIRLDHQALLFEQGTALVLRLALDALDGWNMHDTHALLYARGGDVLDIVLEADDARAVLRAALDEASTVPELARSLRAMGGAVGGNPAAQDRWFAPLLTMRRSLVGVSDPLRQVALFDVDRVRAELARALEELAAQRVGGDLPRTRALEAMLEEQTEGVRAALARVALAGTTLEGSAPDSRLADWRRWIQEVSALFRSADDAWPAIAQTLRDGP